MNNNNDGNGGYYIDLEGLDTINLGGNISIEMVIQNKNLTKDKVLYFQTMQEEISSNNDTALISCKYRNTEDIPRKMQFLVRTDTITKADYRVNGKQPKWRTAASGNNSISTDNTEFIHYIFTISYISGTSSLKIFINGNQSGETQDADLVKQLSSDANKQIIWDTENRN